MKNKKKRFKEGAQPEAATLQWIADQLDRFQNIRSEDLIISTGNGFVTIGENKNDCLYVALDSGGNGGHSWHEVTPGASGTFATTPGGRSATTSDGPAFELNNKSVASGKVVKICPGYEEEWLFEYIASGCGGSINYTACCGGSPGCTPLSVTWELLASDGITVLATSIGTSCNFIGLNGSATYYLRISKTGYWTKTSTAIVPGCGVARTGFVYTWPTSFTATVNVKISLFFSCPVNGATVTVSGDGSGTATTNSSGVATVSISTSSTSYIQSLTVSISPPSGIGADSSSTSVSWNPCSSNSVSITLPPDSSHAANICYNSYLPKTLYYSDDFGSCTLSFDNGGAGVFIEGNWLGSYTYSTTGIDLVSCPPFMKEIADQPISVTVGIVVSQISKACSGSQTWKSSRSACFITAYLTCSGSGSDPYKCQTASDSACGGTSGSSTEKSFSMPCNSSSLSGSFTYNGVTTFPSTCYDGGITIYPESNPSATITGTI